MEFTLKDALDIVLRLGDRVSTFWSYLATIELTVIVVIASLDDLSMSDKRVATIAFVIFMGFHWMGLSHQYKLLNAAVDELQMHLPEAKLKSEAFKKVLGKANYRKRIYLMALVYASTGIMILYLIWDKAWRIHLENFRMPS